MPWYAMVCPNGHRFETVSHCHEWDVCDECGAKAEREDETSASFMLVVEGGATFVPSLSPEEAERAEGREYARQRRAITSDKSLSATEKSRRLNKLHWEREHDKGNLHNGKWEINVPRGAVDAPDRPRKFY